MPIQIPFGSLTKQDIRLFGESVVLRHGEQRHNAHQSADVNGVEIEFRHCHTRFAIKHWSSRNGNV